MIRPFQLQKINVLTWNVLDGSIPRFLEYQGAGGIGNHSTRHGYHDTSGIGFDRNRMIWTWSLTCFPFIFVLFFR